MNILEKTAAYLALALLPAAFVFAQPCAKDTGYRGIWYYNQKTNTEYVYKYSGGLGTYCANHLPLAVYAPEAKKTFFVYGGTPEGKNTLLEMAGSYDHVTATVSRPTILMDKQTDDAHDNPALAIDGAGYLWVFASSHGTARPSFIFKSKRPYDCGDFDRILETNFSYPQPWYIEGKGFLFPHTYYKGGRGLNVSTSPDGVTWSERKIFAHIEEGHYQVSWPCGGKVGTMFNMHPTAYRGNPKEKGLNWRTNMYYIETPDMGATWHTADGTSLEIPIVKRDTPALVKDYEAEGLLCYTVDLKYDAEGHPVLLYITSRSWEPGPEGGPHVWRIAHWTGVQWVFSEVTESDNNYDFGSLYIESNERWRIIAPTVAGPQPFNPGGEMAMWTSPDAGLHWNMERQLTHDSTYNHTYARVPLHAHPEFYAFWADGDARKPSPSRLYFYNLAKDKVYRLPENMDSETAAPEAVE